ncbi:hypothetical protein [Vibrio phage J14]|nr:hypothetical protein [Vibrio phage J14]
MRIKPCLRYEKIRAQKPSDKTPVTSDELIQKLNNGSGVKPSYKGEEKRRPYAADFQESTSGDLPHPEHNRDKGKKPITTLRAQRIY